MKKKRSIGGVIGVVALVATTLLATAPAYATDSRTGYRECNPNRTIHVTSTTTTAGSSGTFAVGHAVGGGSPVSVGWSSAGYHASSHGVPGGSWAISTTGTISSGGASCV